MTIVHDHQHIHDISTVKALIIFPVIIQTISWLSYITTDIYYCHFIISIMSLLLALLQLFFKLLYTLGFCRTIVDDDVVTSRCKWVVPSFIVGAVAARQLPVMSVL